MIMDATAMIDFICGNYHQILAGIFILFLLGMFWTEK